MDKLDREIVLQTIRGYEEVNRITESERIARLRNMTVQESMEIFRDLYRVWGALGAKTGGDLERLNRRRLEETLDLRRKLNEASRRLSAG
jgi:hypothetical protein